MMALTLESISQNVKLGFRSVPFASACCVICYLDEGKVLTFSITEVLSLKKLTIAVEY